VTTSNGESLTGFGSSVLDEAEVAADWAEADRFDAAAKTKLSAMGEFFPGRHLGAVW
jgi:hypothetical protein